MSEAIDMICHPPHYRAGDIESIDVIETYRLGFALGNAVKYLLRAGRKSDDAATCIGKAQWYIRRAGSRPGYEYQHGDADHPRPTADEVIAAFGLDEYRAEAIRCLLVKRVQRADVLKCDHYVTAALKQASER